MYDGDKGTLEPITEDKKSELEAAGRISEVFDLGEIVFVKGGSFRITKFYNGNRMMLKAIKKKDTP